MTTAERTFVHILEDAAHHVDIDTASFDALSDANANTKISYLYRDADNYKQSGEAIFAGVMAPSHLEAILDHLDEDGGFVPAQVGMADLQPMMASGWNDDTDHPFHEIAAIELTEQAADNVAIGELSRLFSEVSWDEHHRP